MADRVEPLGDSIERNKTAAPTPDTIGQCNFVDEDK
jgi:hypothetical protein